MKLDAAKSTILSDLHLATTLPTHNEPESTRLMKYRGSINKLSKLASSQQDAISNDDIPFVKSVEETLIQPESVQASIMALLTLLTTDYNPDSKVMSAVVAEFNSERGPQSRQEGGKGVGYLRALGEVGRRVERGGWGNVFVGGGKGGEGVGVGFQEGSSANKRGAREGATVNVSKEDAILKTELDLLQTLHKSKYLLDLITECKTLTRKCKQYAQLSKNNDRDEGVALNWRELLIRFRWCKEIVGEEVFFHNK
ncbi:hypothetical protein TrCOL_g12612 [Triparma columacea]|uniref:Uncharacterized protein n=1 Tax=Triparma columacea TaxID=722753 RepID=A0A9W7GQG8_9STRA|nr:hypothetical protein TrCOL_g12612 [Triparma columacea]